MALPSGLLALAFPSLGALTTYFIFRRAAGSTIVHRIPVFLTSAVPLLYRVVFLLVPIGIAWALVNAARDRERKANLVGLATGVGLVVLSVFLTATFGLFF